MDNFSQFLQSTLFEDKDLELNIMGIIKTYNGNNPIMFEDDHILTVVPDKTTLKNILNSLPEYIDFDVLVTNLTDADLNDAYSASDDEFEIKLDNVDDNKVVFDLIVYTYNMRFNKVESETLDEVKRTIKINSRGKRRIKMMCKKGFKFDGRKCVKISGKELVNKRRAILKSVRTKRSKGSGFAKRTARLRNRALKKRKGMGL